MSSLREHTGNVSVLVIGDVMLDRHISGCVDRISPEAPVPVVRIQRETEAPGGAGHVAVSLAALGCRVTLAGAVGDDQRGALLQQLIATRGIQDRLVLCGTATTITKTRVIGGLCQQLLRLDDDGRPGALGAACDELWRSVENEMCLHDVVIIADYDKSTVTSRLAECIVSWCRVHRVPCIVDSKRQSLQDFRGATLLAPNVIEMQRVIGHKLDSEKAISQAAQRTRRDCELDYMIITRGSDGMTVASEDRVIHIPAHARLVADVTGAGDTVTAVLAVCAGLGWQIEDAARLASIAAGLAVSKPGAYAVPLSELDAAYCGRSRKIVDWGQAKDTVAAAQRSGQVVVFTNGCFDLLHAGHLASLELARQLGDMLVVGLNSDVSVNANKGAGRPVISQEHRAALLAGLACVDLVVIFDEERPELLVRHLCPDVLAKGSDYHPGQIAGAEFVKSRGGRIVTLPLISNLSTTRIIETQRNNGTLSD